MATRKLKLVSTGVTRFQLTAAQGGGEGTSVILGFNRILNTLEIAGVERAIQQALSDS